MAIIQRQSRYLYDSEGKNVVLPRVIIQDLIYPDLPAGTTSFDPDDVTTTKGEAAIASCLAGQTLNIGGLKLISGTVEAQLENNKVSIKNNDSGGLIELFKNVKIGGNLNAEEQITGKYLKIYSTSEFGGIVHITSTLSSSDVTTGALVVDGGLGVAKNLNVGTNINASGSITAVNQLVAGNGLKVDAGGMSIKGTINTIDGPTTFKGNITASGYDIKAKALTLSSDATVGGNITATSTGKGIITANNVKSIGKLTVSGGGVEVTGDSKFSNNVVVGGKVKGKVNNVDGVELGMPIGSITMWGGHLDYNGWQDLDTFGVVTTPFGVYDDSANNASPWLSLNGGEFKLKVDNPSVPRSGSSLYAHINDTDYVWIPKCSRSATYSSGSEENFSYWMKASLIQYRSSASNFKLFTTTSEKANITRLLNRIIHTCQFRRDGGSIVFSIFEVSTMALATGTYFRIGLPNMRGRMPMGSWETESGAGKNEYHQNLGSIGGEATHTLTVDEMPKHGAHMSARTGVPVGEGDDDYGGKNHYVGESTDQWANVFLPYSRFSDWRQDSRGWKLTSPNEMYPSRWKVGGDVAHNNMPPYLPLNFIVKYK